MADTDRPLEGTARVTAADRYAALTTLRDPALRRAQWASRLTLPSLIPPDDTGDSDELYEPFQSLGARGVTNLASKLMLALFPPNQPFFRLSLSAKTKEEIANNPSMEEVLPSYEEGLSKLEQRIREELESSTHRSSSTEALLHLIVGGNVLVFVKDNGGLTVYPLSKYCLKRDKEGDVIDIVLKERFSRETLPEEAEAIVNQRPDMADDEASASGHENTVNIYTWIRRDEDDKKWKVHQEVLGVVIPETEGSHKLDESPWLPLRFTKVDGTDYARGFVEPFMGDLRSLERGTQAILDLAAAAAKILFFVDDAGLTRREDVARSPSGSVVDGRATDVTILQMDKFHDFTVVNSVVEKLERRLEQAFLMLTGLQRDAERVTAEEIRAIIRELEEGLGGVYSILSQEFQGPYIRRVLTRMEGLPRLPEGVVAPAITTGVEALGRASDLVKFRTFIQSLQEVAGPEITFEHIKFGQLAKLIGAALGVDSEELLRSDTEVEMRRQQRMEEQAALQAAPQVAKAATEQQGQTPTPEGGA